MKNKSKQKAQKRERRHGKIRAKVSGTSARPRLSIFKSNKFLYAQIIDDETQKTLVSVNTKNFKGKSDLEKANAMGKDLAEKAKTKDISKVVFDRGGYMYTGKVKALADGAREGGLNF